MIPWTDHLAIVPILLPLLMGAVMMTLDDTWRTLKGGLGILSTLGMLAVAILLVMGADSGTTIVYRAGAWPANFGIVLVVDRLSAMMLVLTALLGFASLLFSLARWHRSGAHFHPLVQFQLMGINGAFLTGDLFNLFVFFEVLLAASYGLAMHGSGIARVRAGLHYIAINLAASLLFLVGVSLMYGVAGTLNMADLAARAPFITGQNRALLEAGAAILGTAFLVKAAMWPLGLWLPSTYAAASAPSAAIFAMLSKVGIYAVLRLWLLLFGPEAGDSAGLGGDFLFFGGIATIVFGAISVLATQDLVRLAGASVLISSGTLLAAIGAGQVGVTAGALYYLASSVLATGAFFLLVELLERGRDVGADVLAVTLEAFGDGDDDEEDPEPGDEIGVAIPATMAILSFCFLACALLLAGLPPLSGFVAKFAILSALTGAGVPAETKVAPASWLLLVMVILSGLATLISMARAGIRSLWQPQGDGAPRVRVVEIAPVLLLIGACMVLTVQAGPTMRYMQSTAKWLHTPQDYTDNVLATPPPRRGGTP